MHSYLKQSTAGQIRAIGPFLDDTDFKTAETGLTVANTDIKLVINGGASADKNSGGGTHRINGVYGLTFDATDTATIGEMFVSVKVAGALPVFATFVVVEEAVYDMLFGASALGYIANAPVNVAQISGDSTAADNVETAFDDTAGAVPWQLISDQGTLQSVTNTTTVVIRASASAEDDVYNGHTIHFVSATTGAKQSALISDYVGATKTVTLAAAVAVALTGTVVYKIVATASSPANADITAIKTKTDFLPSATAGAAGGVFIAGANAATTVNITGNVTGNLTGSVGSVSGAVGSVTGAVGSVTAEVTANVAKINGVTVIGAGTGGNLWRA